MESCQVTVLMPVFNSAAYLAETIDSILSQTYKDFEFLIINDGSTDDSENIILNYRDPRIRYLKNPRNMGIIETLNKGLELIRSKYIVRMDADDLAFPERIAVQVAFMEEHPTVAVAGSGKINFSDSKEAEYKIIRPIVDEKILYFESIFNTSIPHPSAIIRNEIIHTYKVRYDPAFFGAEDKAMWLDLAKHGTLGNIIEPLIKYRAHENQISYTKQEEGRRHSVAKTLQVLQEYGITFDDQEKRALSFLCYPDNCGDIHMLYATQYLADKLGSELYKLGLCDADYINTFFYKRLKRNIVWSTPVGLPLLQFIYSHNKFRFREFGYVFYKKTFQKAKK